MNPDEELFGYSMYYSFNLSVGLKILNILVKLLGKAPLTVSDTYFMGQLSNIPLPLSV